MERTCKGSDNIQALLGFCGKLVLGVSVLWVIASRDPLTVVDPQNE
jgi:hypothetical protein